MKKNIIILVIIILLGGMVWLGNFYYKNLRGAGPAIKKPPQDIRDLIPSSEDLQSKNHRKIFAT